MSDDYWVTVCDACNTASCWHGVFMCQRAKTAGVVQIKASDLRRMNLEHPENYSRATITSTCGRVQEIE